MNKSKILNHKSFYFLRHGQTDHNLFRIFDDFSDVELNQTGINQAMNACGVLKHIDIKTVCTSPLKRVQQTKMHALQNKSFDDVIIDELKECSGSLWKLFLEKPSSDLTDNEENLIKSFFNRVEIGLKKALSYEGPVLIIAHGGTYLAISKILNARGDNNINNCELAHFTFHQTNCWEVVKLIESNHV